jgi:flagellar protein FlgJ
MRLAAGPATASADALALQKHLKLKDAAERFEGMMLEELLKPMQEGNGGSFGGYAGGFGSDNDEDRDDSLDTISSFGTEAVATAIAKAGGMGIAKQVLREVGALDADQYGHKGVSRIYDGSLELNNGCLRSRNGILDEKIKKKS